jgi:putative ABC transport system permease protein
MNLRFALRNILKRPFLNLIKVFGLSLSFAGFLLIFLFLQKELTYDRFFSKADRIYRLTVTGSADPAEKHFARVNNTTYIPDLAVGFPEIENYVRMAPMRGGVLKYEQHFIPLNEAFEVDSIFFQVFDAELVRGNPATVLNEPASMVVSEAFAARVFGKDDPVGKVLVLPEGQFYGTNTTFTVKGVMKAWPQNCHFHPELITSPVNKSVFEGWAWTYLLLKSGSTPDRLVSEFPAFYTAHMGASGGNAPVAHLQALPEIHLYSNKLREIEPAGNLNGVHALSLAALILWLIALANYANLNLGMAGYSEKYIHMSRVCGSTHGGVIRYFLTENALLAGSSVAAGLAMAGGASRLVQQHIGLDLMAGQSMLILLVFAGLFLSAMVAGIFPLIRHLGVDHTGLTHRLTLSTGRGRAVSRAIIVVQYTISIALIVSAMVVGRQTRYALEQGMGSTDSNLICFEDVHTDVQARFELFKAELLKNSSVESVTAMFEPPGGEANDMFQFTLEGYVPDAENPADSYIGIFPCDYSFAGVFKLKLLAGRDFSSYNEDKANTGEYLINEAAVKRLRFTDPEQAVGKSFALNTRMEDVPLPAGKIIGVLADFHLSNLKKKVEPLVLFKRKDLWLINFVVSPRKGLEDKAILDIRDVWTRLFPDYPFEYKYIGSMYRSVYRSELVQTMLMTVFTVMALLICAMGMLGLTLMTIQRRVKEVGIRKIHGAGITDIIMLLNRDLIRWVLVAFALSVPAAVFLMNRWLGNFAYKTPLSWWIFVLAGGLALLVTLVTVSVRSYRAATRNPVEALRYE